MSSIDNVSVQKQANVYFDGKCVSYSLTTPDGARKSVGVIFPASLTFGTAAPELMELITGRCRVRFDGSEQWQEYAGGEEFSVPGDSKFDIEVSEPVHYVCHYG